MTRATPPPPLAYGRPDGWRHRPDRWLTALALAGTVVSVLAISVLVFPPSTNMQREWKRRDRCAANLRQIGDAIGTYCDGHHGSYPDTLATLVRAVPDLSPVALVCPDADDVPAAGPTRAAVADAVAAGGHCSYRYVGSGLTRATATATTVVIYEPVTPVDGHEFGCNILWGDGHADWQYTAAAAEVVPPAATQPWINADTHTPQGIQIE